MIIRVDKNKILKEFQEKYLTDRYKKEFVKIIETYNKDKDSIKENLISKFSHVCKEAIELQEKKQKGEIKYVYFSALRTRIIENKGIWRIDLYDEKWFLDKEECSINLEFDFIYEPLFDHMKELIEKKKEYGRTIKNKDIEAIKIEEANKYHGLAFDVIKDMLRNFLESTQYKKLKKKEDIEIWAGEYKDINVKIYSKKHVVRRL